MESILLDVRFAFGALRRAPISTAVVTVFLALGVGANTAIYSLTHATLLRSLELSPVGRLFVLSKVVSGSPASLTTEDAAQVEPMIEDLASVSRTGGAPQRPPSVAPIPE